MATDPQLLARAQAAGARLAEAEKQVLLERAEYHSAIRRLHLAGATLREVADALSLSHQRVQQIVRQAGGTWWLVGRSRGREREAVCSWCERPPSEVNKLVAGPDVFICDRCIVEAEHAVRVIGGTNERCSFCHKRASRENPLVVGTRNVCRSCLRVCQEIVTTASL